MSIFLSPKPDTDQSLVFDHNWSLPVAVASDLYKAHARALELNKVCDSDAFDADLVRDVVWDDGPSMYAFPAVGFYFDGDRQIMVKEVD